MPSFSMRWQRSLGAVRNAIPAGSDCYQRLLSRAEFVGRIWKGGRLKVMRIKSSRCFGIAALATVLMLSASAAAQESEILQKSERSPRFSFKTEQGKWITPTSFGGKLLVINFWETACVPCVKELPSLSEFARAFRSKGVVVVAVGSDEDGEKYQRFLTDHHVQLGTYRDPTRRISKAFGTDAYPETYLIHNGRIIGKVVGGIDWTGQDITSFLKERLDRH
jgi:cytochrome c biogenesis protein CcmG, thiol:disulfide interchange protein DsbE